MSHWSAPLRDRLARSVASPRRMSLLLQVELSIALASRLLMPTLMVSKRNLARRRAS